MARYGVLAVATTLATVLACESARAQETSSPRAAAEETDAPSDCPTPATASARRREAGRLFAQGERDTEGLRVGAAARAFACSYALVATAQAAYNAGVAYECIEDAARARQWFVRYRERAPEAEDGRDVDRRIAALEQRLAERRAREQATRAEEGRRAEATRRAMAARAATVRAERARAEGSSRRLRLTGFIVGGTGVATVLAGVVVYGVADGVHDDFLASGRTDSALARRGETLDAAASSLWITGGAVTLAGGALTLFEWLGRSQERPPGSARLAPYVSLRGQAGGELGLRGVF